MEEEYFPRGGKKQHKKFDAEDGEEKLFSEEPEKKKKKGIFHEPDGKPEKREFNKKYKKKGSEELRQEQPHALSYKDLYPGTLLLGCVKKIRNYDMIISLPNGVTGQVSIGNISPAYTDSLQRFSQAQAQGIEEETVHTLGELFKVGMVVPCKLLEYDNDGPSRKATLTLSPQDVNQAVIAANLQHGMCLYGSVSSVEDHGYTVDLGVKGVNAFLNSNEADKYLQRTGKGSDLKVGQCLKCKLLVKNKKETKSEQNRVVHISLNCDGAETAGMVDQLDIPFSALVPGMKTKATIDKIVDEGLIVSFKKYRGMVHRSHLPASVDKYSVGDEIVGCILFTHPLSKSITLTTLSYLVNNPAGICPLFQTVKLGEIIAEAKVTAVNVKGGVSLKLAKNLSGFATLKNLSDTLVEDIEEHFKKGSTHRCRVIDYQPMENVALVSAKQSVLDQKYVTLEDVQPGDLVQCTITKMTEKGVLVSIQKGLQAFIPTMHLADVTLQHPEKKFKVDDKLRCRVLLVNTERSRLTLTNKKSLIQSKLPIVYDYSQIKPGQILEGFIGSVKDFGVHVRFYGNVQGLVPRVHLSTEPIQFPEKVFYLGQVVRARVMHVDSQLETLKLSLVLEGKRGIGQKEADAPEDFEIGKLVKCKVEKKTEKGLDVELLPSNKKAFLPMFHLSDSLELCQLLLEAYQPGDKLQAMYLNKTNIVIVTRKHSFMQAEKKGELIHEFDILQADQMMPGSVKNIMPYGVFVQFAGKLFGLVPNHMVTDTRVQDLSTVYKHGQSVQAKVVEVNKEKKRFLATLRMSECYHDDTDEGVKLLQSYMTDKWAALRLLKKHKGSLKGLADIRCGQVCPMTVTEVNEDVILGNLDNGVTAIAVQAHVEGQVDVGSTVKCATLDIDLDQKCVQVSLLARHIKSFQKIGPEQLKEKVEESLQVQGEITLVHRDYLVIRLYQPAAGRLAYSPIKKHLNDVLDHNQFNIGDVYMTAVESVKDSKVYVSLGGEKKQKKDGPSQKASKLEKKMKEWTPAVTSRNEVKVGQLLDGQVLKYSKQALIVRLGTEIHGSVSYDQIRQGYILTKGKLFKSIGTKVTVKVLQKPEDETKPIELSMLKKDTGVTLRTKLLHFKRSGSEPVDEEEWEEEEDSEASSPKARKRKISDSASETVTHVKTKQNESTKKRKKRKRRKSDIAIAHRTISESSDADASSDAVTKRAGEKRIKSDSDSVVPKKKGKLSDTRKGNTHDSDDSGVDIQVNKSKGKDQPLLEVSEGFSWVTDFKMPSLTDTSHRESSDESDTEDTKPVKKSKAERRQEKLDEEKRLYQLERQQLEGDLQPETGDDFDRLVLQSPDSSLVWLRYMAFHLETSEIDKARAVAERALKTISFREEQEKLNVWVAYLNLENMYGSGDSLDKVLGRAIQQNDAVKVNLQMVNIYQTSNKTEANMTGDGQMARLLAFVRNQEQSLNLEAERLFNNLVRKYSGEKDLWFKFGTFYFEQGRMDSARKLLQRALKSLPTKFHVETISKFAQLEFKLGEPERGKTMYENILSTYPNRTDLWSVYIDMVTKLKDHTATRALYDRVINMKMGAKKMKFFFKKFLGFEEQYGTTEQVASIKQRALDYVESQGYVDG